MQTFDLLQISKAIGTRESDSHKGDYGKVLLIAGSVGMTGAAVLAASGAYKSGAGFVASALPERLFPIMQVSVPEAICVERKPGKLDYMAYDAVVFGPGLGLEKENAALLTEVLKNYKGPVVIDADGLNCIAKYDLYQSLLTTEAQVVITPHPGEAKRLLAITGDQDRETMAASLTRTLNVVCVLKGAGTLIFKKQSDGALITHKNPTGNPGMATAGSGDVLSGVIGAFLAKGVEPFDAACAGVYVHGAAGDLAAMEIGETGLMASDICRQIPYAIRNITGK
jgi:hydroxyethylthiazole kinase-like uncharacterized protein yjeF